jgi:GT2 family glycosyltransferase
MLVANSRSVTNLDLECETLRPLQNTGFGGAVRYALDYLESDRFAWDWLLIANDDLDVSASLVRQMVEAVGDEARQMGAHVILFDPEAARRVPSWLGVFLDLSLGRQVLAHLRRSLRPKNAIAAGSPGLLAPGSYKSFSLVAINRSAWLETGGLSGPIRFCYEDADFIRRFQDLYPLGVSCVPLEIHHEHSSSTRSVIDEILPVIADSARMYLARSGVPDLIARAVIVVALAVRTIPASYGSSDRRLHRKGIRRAIASQFSHRVPPLPSFEGL